MLDTSRFDERMNEVRGEMHRKRLNCMWVGYLIDAARWANAEQWAVLKDAYLNRVDISDYARADMSATAMARIAVGIMRGERMLA